MLSTCTSTLKSISKYLSLNRVLINPVFSLYILYTDISGPVCGFQVLHVLTDLPSVCIIPIDVGSPLYPIVRWFLTSSKG